MNARINHVWLLTGSPGAGKTVMMVSYKPFGNDRPKRLIIDKETRSLAYNAEIYGFNKDMPEALLYSFELYPDQTGIIGAQQFGELIKRLKGPDRPDVLGIDNVSMLQDDIMGWCQESKGARTILESLGIAQKHETFLRYNFQQNPYWRNLLKEILMEFLLTAKRNGIDIVITTELRNEWENYGVKGYGPDGKPMQRIVGKTAKAWDSLLKITDVVWLLSRNNETVTARPDVQIDPLSPKMSIVGIPAKFKFESWDQVWKWIKARGVLKEEDFKGISKPEIEYREGEPENEDGDPLETKKQELIETLIASGKYANRKEIGLALKKLGIEYTLDQHDEILAKLME